MVFTERQKAELKILTSDIAREIIKTTLSTDQVFMNTLIDKISDKVSERIKNTLENLTSKINSLESKIMSLESDNMCLKSKLDESEQRSKLNCLRIYGLPETQENSNTSLNVEIGMLLDSKLNFKGVMPSNAYRIGRKSHKKVRSTVVVFDSMSQRNAVYQNKRKLKGSNIIIVEELTKTRHQLLQLSKEKLGRENIWTLDGKIFARVGNKKHFIRTEDDIVNIAEGAGASEPSPRK